MRKRFLADSSIVFPAWVTPPTPCKTRTFSMVLPGGEWPHRHGAMRVEKAFANRPVEKAHRIDRPGYYVKWAEMGTPTCPITGYANCIERHCELHYSLAPVRLK